MIRPALGLGALLAAAPAHATDVLVCFASTYNADVMSMLNASGRFAAVDQIDCQFNTPTPGQLAGYDAVLVYSDFGFSNAALLGDRLADYVDTGGGVVVSLFANSAAPPTGRFESQGYEPLVGSSFGSGVVLTMVMDEPSHAILDGVATFNAGTSSYNCPNCAVPGAGTLIAHYNNGVPLIATLETKPGRIVGLNFYPPSSAIRADFWPQNTDGEIILANALDWTGNRDEDQDGLASDIDNCPLVANPLQEDADLDSIGDVCDPCDDRVDPDSDADGVCDSTDQCPGDDIRDGDGDGTADGCDSCPLDAAPDDDGDGDGVCNAVDQCPNGDDLVDSDGDTFPDGCDLCAGFDDLTDFDLDLVPDGCDNCVRDENRFQYDDDDDGVGSQCDCDDDDASVNDLATELCDDVDNDCDGEIDEPGAIGPRSWFEDLDGDGQGAAGTVVNGCTKPENAAVNSDDCDDTNPLVFLGAEEYCDARDTDCDGVADNGLECDLEEAQAEPVEPTSCGECNAAGSPPAAALAWAAAGLLLWRRRR